MSIVNFIILGAMKSGTTTLTKMLREHPKLDIPPRELQFFSDVSSWNDKLELYHQNFIGSPDKVKGEASTHYAFYPNYNLNIWDDIYEYNPKMKFIYVLRDPYDRTISQYMHMYERGYISCDLEKAIRTVPSLINNSRYYTQIIPFIRKFGADKVLILNFEDLITNAQTEINKVCSFLEVDNFEIKNIIHENVTIGGGKWHIKYDHLKTKLNRFRKLLPRQLRNRIWDVITGRKKRAFKVKPKLEMQQRQIITNLLELDFLALEKLTGYKYSNWLDKD